MLFTHLNKEQETMTPGTTAIIFLIVMRRPSKMSLCPGEDWESLLPPIKWSILANNFVAFVYWLLYYTRFDLYCDKFPQKIFRLHLLYVSCAIHLSFILAFLSFWYRNLLFLFNEILLWMIIIIVVVMVYISYLRLELCLGNRKWPMAYSSRYRHTRISKSK